MKQIFLLLSFLIFVSCGDSQKSSSENTVEDIDGNVYKTVKIGNQVWMAENLRVTHFRNGDEIPNHADGDEWNSARPAYCNYDNDEANGEIYGKIYNWFAVSDSRNIAPEGWHVASDEEWKILVEYLGGDTVAGGKLKSTGSVEGGDGLWVGSNKDATNESGFSALPGGYRYNHGVFDSKGRTPYFWTSTDSDHGSAWYYYLNTENSNVHRYDGGGWKQEGYSVRCIKD